MEENKRPLESYSTEELAGLVSLLPWFSAARVELCRRTCGADISGYAPLAIYVASRSVLYRMYLENSNRESGNENSGAAISSLLTEKKTKKVRAAGGDFFSQEEYDTVSADGGEFKVSFTSEPSEEITEQLDFCTESLAAIYTEQGYFDEARKIYSQLSLRYPEKSTYFATLSDNLDKLEKK